MVTAVTVMLAGLALASWPGMPPRMVGLGRSRALAARPATGERPGPAAEVRDHWRNPRRMLLWDRRLPTIARLWWHSARARFVGAGTGAGARTGARAGAAVALGFGVAALSTWACGAAAVVAVATVTRLVGRARSFGRARRAVDALVAALRALARELDAGAEPPHALAEVVQGAPPDVGRLLVVLPFVDSGLPQDALGDTPRVSRGARSLRPGWAVRPGTGALTRHFGGPAATGGVGGHRSRDPSADQVAGVRARLAAGWELSARHGIPLAAVARTVAADLADQARAADARAAQVAGPAVSGYVLACLPIAGLLLGSGMGADPLGVLTGSAIGGVLLVAGTVLCCTGLLWADRIVRR